MDDRNLSGKKKTLSEKLKSICAEGLSLLKRAVRTVWFWLLMLFPVSLIIMELAKNVPGLADGYCGSVYKVVSVFWNNVTGVLPFSLGEILVILVIPAVLTYFTIVTVRIIRKKNDRIHRALLGLVRPVACCSLAFFLYVTNCGINYYCSGFLAKSGWEIKAVSKEELYEVCVWLADTASDSRSRLPENPDGTVNFDLDTAPRRARDAINGLHSRYDFVAEGYSVPKKVMLSRGMSYLNITGIYFPFTFEANVNVDIPEWPIPYNMCHEMAHVRGWMNEGDANFIAYLSCLYSGDDELVYSACYMALRNVSGHLYSADRELYAKFVSHLSEGYFRDSAAHSEYWKQFETPVATAATAINDHYLKQHSQSDGVRTYGKAADLVITHYFLEVAPSGGKLD